MTPCTTRLRKVYGKKNLPSVQSIANPCSQFLVNRTTVVAKLVAGEPHSPSGHCVAISKMFRMRQARRVTQRSPLGTEAVHALAFIK